MYVSATSLLSLVSQMRTAPTFCSPPPLIQALRTPGIGPLPGKMAGRPSVLLAFQKAVSMSQGR